MVKQTVYTSPENSPYCADVLAKRRHVSDASVVFLDDVPSFLVPALLVDMAGASLARGFTL